MNYNIEVIPPFDRQLKRLVKKYPSIKQEFSALIDSLEVEPHQGTPLGDGCYKIRIAIRSKGKGKSGGARVVTNVMVTEQTVYLLSIYDKSEKANLTDKELEELLKYVP
ncbi:type II toxin-antitoxin system RelE/ParE family toxin [Mucilaginibacter myungsuensis]|uniref:Type II toxin-antitoxin system RelE/ParE family toxin n=1 Tax=Mucilaginibacter myungsuensis TaxID=649104 RepID=A0A929PWW6_9SPHI|nr:type II toxin-antitoxin system RelE/ParE family toxin [Mucilaginibacter myungsuensis]MBE9661775.1 type II toxin-antitoxin system RelE/ParE family toxin [Mucilaginibacter myungsuensis]MDN3599791.1 type II toxin-antitoxin system RelE/ParE family toxin [Mucilaginibacter myungsuensis]